MLPFRQTLWRSACLLLATGSLAACATASRPVALPPHGPLHQFIAQAATGFVIRAGEADASVNAAPTSTPVTVGSTVRFDRDALISNHP